MTNPISRAEPLLPCPFCGGEAIMQVGMSSFGDYEISCTKCFMCGPTFGAMEETLTPKEDAIAAWNTRAMPAVALGEPEAVRYGFDGYGWKYMDAGSGSDWLKRAMAESDAEPLYDNPASQTDPRDAVIAQLVGAVKFYADWDSWVLDERGVSLIEQDEGKLARAAIAAAKGGA